MRRASRVDDNQADLVAELRGAGMSVAVTSQVGHGFPDLVVGYEGRNLLLEVKDPNKSPSRRKLTPDEVKWHDEWQGTVYVVTTPQEVLELFDD